MGYKHYTPEFKTQVVLEVLREEKALGEIAAEKNLNPNGDHYSFCYTLFYHLHRMKRRRACWSIRGGNYILLDISGEFWHNEVKETVIGR